MYNTSHQQSHSHHSRSPVDPAKHHQVPPQSPHSLHQQQQQHQQQHQQQQHQQHSQLLHQPQYNGSSLFPQHPTISQQPPTPTSGLFQTTAQQPGNPSGFASHPVAAPSSQLPDILNPTGQRLRSGSGSLISPDLSQSDSSNLRRSSSLNDAMANPQTGYYQMPGQMSGGYQHQMYSQAPLPQSNYYAGSLPQLSVPLSSSYVGEPRQQQMRPASGNYGSYNQQMPYSQPSYPPNSYATSYQSSESSMIAPSSSSPYNSHAPMAGSPAGISYGSQRPSPPTTLSGAPMHVVDRQKKPQCWDHGCNGREFSTFSNLLRHQREKSGTAAKSYCPHCGAEFTRTTARNGHMEHGKCKTRRTQTGGSGS